MIDKDDSSPKGDWTPRPDPTVLTTEALRREIDALRTIIEAEILAQRERVGTRLDAMDKAIILRESIIDKQPAITDTKIAHLQALHDERFKGIDLRFSDRDVSVATAFAAAKEAVAEQNKSSALAISKSEIATTKQIDQIGTLVQSTVAGIGVSIADVKERLTRIEGESRGKVNEDTTHRSISANTVGIAGLVIGSLIGLGGLLVSFLDHSQSAAMSYPVSNAQPQTQPPQIIYVPIPPPQGTQQSAPK